jgi:hypothetical protein
LLTCLGPERLRREMSRAQKDSGARPFGKARTKSTHEENQA